jgi:hypothetical protein
VKQHCRKKVFVGKIPIAENLSVLSYNNIVDFPLVIAKINKSVFDTFVVTDNHSFHTAESGSIANLALGMTKIFFDGCDIRERMGIRIVKFFFRHSVEVLTEREFNALAFPTRNNTTEERVFSILDNTVDANGLFKFGEPFVGDNAVEGFTILFIGSGMSRDIHALDLRVAIDEGNKLVKVVANTSSIDIDVFVRGNGIDDFAESEDICHRLAASDYNLGDVERVVVSENVFNSIYNTIERGAIFGIFLFAFAEGTVVGAVERHHNCNCEIVAT